MFNLKEKFIMIDLLDDKFLLLLFSLVKFNTLIVVVLYLRNLSDLSF